MGGWIRQQDTDMPSHTEIDDDFVHSLYKTLGLVQTADDVPDVSTDGTSMLRLPDAILLDARTLIKEYAHLFTPGDPKLQPVTSVQCEIETLPGQKPLASPSYPLAEANRQIMSDTVKYLLSKGIIQRSTSPCSSPVVIARKKDHTTGEWSAEKAGLLDGNLPPSDQKQ